MDDRIPKIEKLRNPLVGGEQFFGGMAEGLNCLTILLCLCHTLGVKRCRIRLIIMMMMMMMMMMTMMMMTPTTAKTT